MTLLDGGGGSGGGSGEVTTLSRSVFHRNGSGTTKKGLSYGSSDINANTTTMANGNFTQVEARRVPDISTTADGLLKDEAEAHDLKKWSEVCKMTNTFKRPESSTSSSNGDSNNNQQHNLPASGDTMDF